MWRRRGGEEGDGRGERIDRGGGRLRTNDKERGGEGDRGRGDRSDTSDHRDNRGPVRLAGPCSPRRTLPERILA